MSQQLSFSVRVSSSIKQVHLLGSWDSYTEHIPLSKDKSSSKTWAGTFRFPGDLVQPGQRYWYYYILDGYHITFDPRVESTVEPTTGRELNILDVSASGGISSPLSPSSSRSKSKSYGSSRHSSSGKRHRQRGATLALDIPKGRPLPQSQIVSPRPISPKTPRHIIDADEDELSSRLAQTGLYDRKGRPRSFDKFRIVGGDRSPGGGGLGVDLDDEEVPYEYYYYNDEYGGYDVPPSRRSSSSGSGSAGGFSSSASGSTLSSPGYGSGSSGGNSPAGSSLLSFGSGGSSPLTSNSTGSSRSRGSRGSSSSGGGGGGRSGGYSTPDSACSSGCVCERWGITRTGERVRIDCGGARCGFDETCSSSDDDGANAGSVGLGIDGGGGGGMTASYGGAYGGAYGSAYGGAYAGAVPAGGMRRNGVIIRR